MSVFFSNILEWFSRSALYWGMFLVAFICALVLTPIVRGVARRLGMVDQPSERRINKTPIPRAGGLAVFLAFQVAMCGYVFVTGNSICAEISKEMMLWALLSQILLVLLGLMDDKFSLPPIVKLLGQIVVAMIVYFGAGVSVCERILPNVPAWIDFLLTIFWIVGAINAFNLIDGLDGLASGLALIASLGVAGALFFAGNYAAMLPYLALAGACLGFLRYNFNPASVFLGDTGSMFLGLLLATLPLATRTTDSFFVALSVPLLALGVPIYDTILAIWRRTVRAALKRINPDGDTGETRVMSADKDHLHHRILRRTLNQKNAALILYGISSLLVLVGIGTVLLRDRSSGLFILVFIGVVVLMSRHMDRVELWDTGRLLMQDAHRHIVRRAMVLPLYVICDVATMTIMWLMVRHFLNLPVTGDSTRLGLLVYGLPVIVVFLAMRIYRQVWSRAQTFDYARLMAAMVIADLFSIAIVILFNLPVERFVTSGLLFVVLSAFPMIVVRLLNASFRTMTYAMECARLLEMKKQRVLVIGGGLRFRAYRRELMEYAGHNETVLVGILDDDLYLRGRMISNCPVLGALDDVEEVIRKHHIDGVVIACRLEDDEQAAMVKRLSVCHVWVNLWQCTERVLISADNACSDSSTRSMPWTTRAGI